MGQKHKGLFEKATAMLDDGHDGPHKLFRALEDTMQGLMDDFKDMPEFKDHLRIRKVKSVGDQIAHWEIETRADNINYQRIMYVGVADVDLDDKPDIVISTKDPTRQYGRHETYYKDAVHNDVASVIRHQQRQHLQHYDVIEDTGSKGQKSIDRADITIAHSGVAGPDDIVSDSFAKFLVATVRDFRRDPQELRAAASSYRKTAFAEPATTEIKPSEQALELNS